MKKPNVILAPLYAERELALKAADDSQEVTLYERLTLAHAVLAVIGLSAPRFSPSINAENPYGPTTITASSSTTFQQAAPVTNRTALIEALATMPDEAFGWFVLACPTSAMMHGGRAQIWPDGMGGFSRESQASVEAVRQAADAYLQSR